MPVETAAYASPEQLKGEAERAGAPTSIRWPAPDSTDGRNPAIDHGIHVVISNIVTPRPRDSRTAGAGRAASRCLNGEAKKPDDASPAARTSPTT